MLKSVSRILLWWYFPHTFQMSRTHMFRIFLGIATSFPWWFPWCVFPRFLSHRFFQLCFPMDWRWFRLEHGAGLAGGVIVSHGPHLEVVFLNDLWRGLGALKWSDWKKRDWQISIWDLRNLANWQAIWNKDFGDANVQPEMGGNKH